jgi:hypothetical protein
MYGITDFDLAFVSIIVSFSFSNFGGLQEEAVLTKYNLY